MDGIRHATGEHFWGLGISSSLHHSPLVCARSSQFIIVEAIFAYDSSKPHAWLGDEGPCDLTLSVVHLRQGNSFSSSGTMKKIISFGTLPSQRMDNITPAPRVDNHTSNSGRASSSCKPQSCYGGYCNYGVCTYSTLSL